MKSRAYYITEHCAVARWNYMELQYFMKLELGELGELGTETEVGN